MSHLGLEGGKNVTIIPKGTTAKFAQSMTPVVTSLGTTATQVGKEVLRQHLVSKGVKVSPDATPEELVAAAALQKLHDSKPTLPVASTTPTVTHVQTTPTSSGTTTTTVVTAKPLDKKANISIDVAEACRICDENKGQTGGRVAMNYNILRYMVGN